MESHVCGPSAEFHASQSGATCSGEQVAGQDTGPFDGMLDGSDDVDGSDDGMLVASFDGMLVGSDDGMLLGALVGALVGKVIVAFFASSAEQHSEDLYDASTFPQVTAVPLKVAGLPVSWEQHELFW